MRRRRLSTLSVTRGSAPIWSDRKAGEMGTFYLAKPTCELDNEYTSSYEVFGSRNTEGRPERSIAMTAMPDRAENILVKGMTCNHCVQSVTAALTKLPGITGVRVDLSAGRVSYQNPDGVERDRIAAAVRQAGFDAQ